jgi:hypothetical protein
MLFARMFGAIYSHLYIILTHYRLGKNRNQDSVVTPQDILLKELALNIPHYPSYMENNLDANKMAAIDILDKVAEKRNDPRPKTSLSPEDIPGQDIVRKRNASGWGSDVKVLDKAKTIKNREKVVFSKYHYMLYQEFVPSLKHQGEVRILILNAEKVISRVATVQTMAPDGREIMKTWSLEAIRPLAQWKEDE